MTEIGIFDTPCNTSSDDQVSVLKCTHKAVLVLSSDGVCQLSLICYVIGISVHIDRLVQIAEVLWQLVLIFVEVRCWAEVIQAVGDQTEAVTY